MVSRTLDYARVRAWAHSGHVVVCVPLAHGRVLTSKYRAGPAAEAFLHNDSDDVRAYSLLCVTAAIRAQATTLGLEPLG